MKILTIPVRDIFKKSGNWCKSFFIIRSKRPEMTDMHTYAVYKYRKQEQSAVIHTLVHEKYIFKCTKLIRN